ncbi:MAG: hypothetical protein AABZ39_18185 [Spirochaetota bacterium]
MKRMRLYLLLAVCLPVLYNCFKLSPKEHTNPFDPANPDRVHLWWPLGTSLSTGAATNINIAVDSAGIPYVIYADGGAGTDVIVKRYANSSWNTVGPAGISGAAVKETAIGIDGSDNVFIVYTDAAGAHRCRKWDGSSWAAVGTQPVVASSAAFSTSLALFNGSPYIAYRSSASGQFLVTAYNTGTGLWGLVGAAVGNQAIFPRIVVLSGSTPPNKFPFVVYEEFSTFDFPNSYWYTNGGWSNRSTGVAQGFAPDIALDAGGTPYMSYLDSTSKPTVRKFVTAAWSAVGTTALNTNAGSLRITADASGTPYIVFRETLNGNVVTVMRYDGSAWAPAGARGFAGPVMSPCIANGQGKLYVGFSDVGNAGRLSVYYYE